MLLTGNRLSVAAPGEGCFLKAGKFVGLKCLRMPCALPTSSTCVEVCQIQ